jgi:hypothetical protein
MIYKINNKANLKVTKVDPVLYADRDRHYITPEFNKKYN